MGVVHVNPDRGFIVRGLRLSAFYIDGMRISTSPDGLRLVTEGMLGRLTGINFDVVAAPSVSGVPYGSVIAERLQKRLAIDRGIPSKYGFHQRIEGEIRVDDRVVIVDDIAKRGETILEIGEQVTSRGRRGRGRAGRCGRDRARRTGTRPTSWTEC
jgi:orotate phosphoribosyltransferase